MGEEGGKEGGRKTKKIARVETKYEKGGIKATFRQGFRGYRLHRLLRDPSTPRAFPLTRNDLSSLPHWENRDQEKRKRERCFLLNRRICKARERISFVWDSVLPKGNVGRTDDVKCSPHANILRKEVTHSLQGEKEQERECAPREW